VSIGGNKSLEIPEPEFSRRIDWRALAGALGLTQSETRLFLAHWHDGIPVSRLHLRLKITRHAAAILYAAVKGKLGINPQAISGCLSVEPVSDSLRPAFRDRLASGARPWALGQFGEEFPEIMHAEKYFRLFSQRDAAEHPKSRVFCAGKIGAPMPNDLQTTLKAEQSKLERIAERLHAGRVAVESTERDLRTAAVELAEEMSAAVLADREPVPGPFEKRISKVQATLDTQRGALAGAVAAHQKQCEIVGGIEGVIQANHHADVIARARPMCKRFAELTDELGRLALEVRIELVGESVQPSELFAGSENPETLRSRFVMLFTMSNFLSGELAMYNPTLRRELFLKYPNQMPENWRADAA
jgi:hypothetical protein